MDHTALGQHYVNCFASNGQIPPLEDILMGNYMESHSYDEAQVHKDPGTKFNYSGGGFLLLQYLIEQLEGGKPIAVLIEPFLLKLGISEEMIFDHDKVKDHYHAQRCAWGHNDDGSVVQHDKENQKTVGDSVSVGDGLKGMLLFPPFAAGSISTCRALTTFWQHMLTAYHRDGNINNIEVSKNDNNDAVDDSNFEEGRSKRRSASWDKSYAEPSIHLKMRRICDNHVYDEENRNPLFVSCPSNGEELQGENVNPISSSTAHLMLKTPADKGSVEFMNSEMGLGVFVLKAGSNRIACHQAANDGFRGVYLGKF